ncbi:hypothetical protein [Spirulina sp. 06S082]|uniref:hypothetical protein n=1 Tax=Spirulina sp. 06S082 TaxID=3110248 RepID=UPI002B21686C|nr:hypothetical protein [Spirulina sp. 06S082]
MQEVLDNKVKQARLEAQRVKEEVARYVTETHPMVADRLNLSSYQNEVDTAIAPLDRATAIDTAIAHQSQIETLRKALIQQVDREAEGLQQRSASEESDTVVKSIVSLSVVNVAKKSVLETPEEVEEYVDALKMALLAELEQNNRVRLM